MVTASQSNHHPEPVKAAVIAACLAGMGVTEAGEIYGVPHPTVSRWMQSPHLVNSPLVDDNKKALDIKAEEVAHRLIDAAPGKIEDATLTGTMTSFGIAVDKMRLLREQSTSINESRDPATSKQELISLLTERIAANAVDVTPEE
jgi:hypothetical protein